MPQERLTNMTIISNEKDLATAGVKCVEAVQVFSDKNLIRRSELNKFGWSILNVYESL